MTPTKRLRDRLISGGWTLDRESKHNIWKHPNGSTFSLGRNVRNKGRSLDNYLKQIERAEKGDVVVKDFVVPPVARPKAITNIVAMPTWGEWLKQCRKKNSISQADTDDLLGFPQGTFSRIESGKRNISMEEMDAFLSAFQCLVPNGIAIPFASEVDMSKRKRTSPPTVVVEEPQVAKEIEPVVIPTAKPIVVPASVDREALVAEAIRILRSTRLTDEEINQLVNTLKSKAMEIITATF